MGGSEGERAKRASKQASRQVQQATTDGVWILALRAMTTHQGYGEMVHGKALRLLNDYDETPERSREGGGATLLCYVSTSSSDFISLSYSA